MTKLVSIKDVNGAAIMRTNGSVISWRSKDNGNNGKPKEYIDYIKNYMVKSYQNDIPFQNEGMFTESIIDYNGSKLLTSRIRKDIMLLLVLDKNTYLGLTMLDVEGCLQNIDSALERNCNLDYNITV
jgi:predicted regulator of Ras-like GTPase activity (Roadblock/LC7/MglB family)